MSTPAAPTVRAEAMMAVPPQGCPMHQEAQPVKGETITCSLIFFLCNMISCSSSDFITSLKMCVNILSFVSPSLSGPTLRVPHAPSSACER